MRPRFARIAPTSSVLFLLAANAVQAAMPIIQPDRPFEAKKTILRGTTGNGSFEGTGSGSSANWIAALGASIAAGNANPPGATAGSFHLRVYETGTPTVDSRADLRRRSIGLKGLADGDLFRVTLDYRVPSADGFNQAIFQLLTNTNGTTLIENGDVRSINPTSSADVWHSVTIYWRATVDGFDGVDFRASFRRNGGSASTYSGYIDNVVIEQGWIPPLPSGTVITIR